MANINIRIDDEVKENAEIVCKELGISLSAAINIYLKKMGREQRIPFELAVTKTVRETNRKNYKSSGGEKL